MAKPLFLSLSLFCLVPNFGTREESSLEECARSCVELRERLKMVVDAQCKEQLVKEFDAIAVYDKADKRAADLVKILMARKLWEENAMIIKNLDGSEPAPENVIFNLQNAYESLSEFMDVPKRADFLEKVKDVYLSWYSTRIVLALQWAGVVLETPSVFLTDAFNEGIQAQEEEIKTACVNTIGKTLDEDLSGSNTLKMVLEFKTMLTKYCARPGDDNSLAECIIQFGELLLLHTAGEYSKLATSFLAHCSNISMDSMTTSGCLEQLTNWVSQLSQESDYLVHTTKETFDSLAIIYLTMYENVVSVLVRFHKVHMERSNVKEEDVLRLVSISGQLMAWIDNDKQRLKDLLEYFRMGGRDPVINKLSHKLSPEISAFREKLSGWF
ncbi:unnamed protein product [Gongylonema pulchrum]|uniref:Secreted protein n=1 Tax=Gongylonema pulchrum TaxID=637853 RepID=A0A183E150_9BILA|nr:unnamed protein product [Gongylonema pulchrum]